MKVAIRRGVFETNSSSTHTLALVTKEDYEVDKKLQKPKYRKFNVITTKRDKLLMACGCCYEIYGSYNDHKTYESILSRIVHTYCDLTGEDYDSTYASISAKNKSGRACHMNFFSEGALYDAEDDYYIIDRLLSGSEDHLRVYFDDNNLLCYREVYGGLSWADFDDDEE